MRPRIETANGVGRAVVVGGSEPEVQVEILPDKLQAFCLTIDEVGARASDILAQFLTEALILSSLGGAIGILIRVAIAVTAQRLIDWPLSIPVDAVGISFGFAAVVGVAFGVYPARRASQLDPIQALRSQ